jgi:hypothetical protein
MVSCGAPGRSTAGGIARAQSATVSSPARCAGRGRSLPASRRASRSLSPAVPGCARSAGPPGQPPDHPCPRLTPDPRQSLRSTGRVVVQTLGCHVRVDQEALCRPLLAGCAAARCADTPLRCALQQALITPEQVGYWEPRAGQNVIVLPQQIETIKRHLPLSRFGGTRCALLAVLAMAQLAHHSYLPSSPRAGRRRGRLPPEPADCGCGSGARPAPPDAAASA